MADKDMLISILGVFEMMCDRCRWDSSISQLSGHEIGLGHEGGLIYCIYMI